MNNLIIIVIVVNLFIFFQLKSLSKLFSVYDKPDSNLKLHKGKVSLLGGPILIINIAFIFFYQLYFSNYFFIFEKNNILFNEYFSILIFLFSFFCLGYYDDKFNLSPNKKFFFIILFSTIIIFLNNNLVIEKFSLSFFSKTIFLNSYSLIFTIFCIMVLTNILNFYDGINGQSTLFSIIVFLFLYAKNQNIFYLLIIIIIFFLFLLNIRNKIFLGDSGIFLLSSIVSMALIFEYNLFENIKFADEIFLLLLLPGIDLIRLTVVRVFNNKNPFYGDRNHIHHLLIRKYNLIITNFILVILASAPIILFNFFKINFFIISLIFIAFYIFIIRNLNYRDIQYNYRRK